MKSLRWKLMLMAMVAVFVPLYVLNRYAVAEFDRFTRRAWEDQMIDVAVIVGELYLHTLREGPSGTAWEEDAFPGLCDTFSAETDSRIRVLSSAGRVVYDSARQPHADPDLSQRPEVAEALQGRYKASWELTPDKSYVFYHCAQPVVTEAGVIGVVVVSRHTGPIVGAILRMYDRQRATTLLALVFSALIAAVLSLTMTRRLRHLTRAASGFARGEASLPVPVKGRDEIGELARTFNRMAGEIDQRNAYNRDFVATTFHELRTPITAIQGAAELLDQGASEKPEARKRFISNIRYQSERLVRLIGELNELTRVDMDTPKAPSEKLDYVDALRGILDRLEPVFEEDRAALEVELPETVLPVRIRVGPFEQVMANLLENAFRYTPPDGEVRVTVHRDGDTVVTRVADTGAGVAASNLERVFDRFFTTEPKDAYRGYGSGLGLAIAKRIIENHRGTIEVKSVEGQGAEFVFTLPLIA